VIGFNASILPKKLQLNSTEDLTIKITDEEGFFINNAIIYINDTLVVDGRVENISNGTYIYKNDELDMFKNAEKLDVTVKGWNKGEYIIADYKNIIEVLEETYGYVNAYKVNIRSEPTTVNSNNIIATLNEGTKLRVIGQTNGWYQALYENQKVWIADWLLDVTLELKRDNVNVRSGPGLNYSIIDTISRGSIIIVNERAIDSNWLKITIDNGKVGYVAEYLVGIEDRLLDIDLSKYNIFKTEFSVGIPTDYGIPEIVGSTIMVPANLIESLGATLSWDAPTLTITYPTGGVINELTEGSTTAVINGENTQLTAVPFWNQENYLMVPLKMISEEFNFNVIWEDEYSGIIINYDYADTTRPVVTVPENVSTNSVSINIKDNIAVDRVIINGTEIDDFFPKSEITEIYTGLSLGENEISVEAIDTNGNYISENVTVIYNGEGEGVSKTLELKLGEATDYGTIKVIDGRTMVPLGIVQDLGVIFEFDSNNETAVCTHGDNIISITANTTTYTLNNLEKQMDSPSYLDDNGNIIVPLRAISEIFGFTVDYNANNKSIILINENYIDNTGPIVTAPETVNTNSVLITIEDDVAVDRVMINGETIDIFSPKAEIIQLFTDLTLGENTIIVDALDTASNYSRTELIVKYTTETSTEPGVVQFTIGQPTDYGVPQLIDGTTIVPVRIVEILGVNFEYDFLNNTVTYSYDENTVSVTDNKSTAIVNGEEVLMTEPAYLNNQGRYMVPIRMVGEELGFEVAWTSNDQPIAIKNKEYIDNYIGAFFAVIDNHPDALQQSNLKKADIVYEYIAEGGITRYIAGYQSKYPDVVGPIRSLRRHYAQTLNAYDTFFVHAGGDVNGMSHVIINNLKSICSINTAGDYFYRDELKDAPHNLYISFEDIQNYVNQSDETYERLPERIYGELHGGIPVDFALLDYSLGQHNNTAKWIFDENNNHFVKKNLGDEYSEVESMNLTADNIIIKEMPVKYTTYQTGLSVNSHSIGSGRAYYLRDGMLYSGTWSKSSANEHTMYYLDDGSEFKYKKGNVWVQQIHNFNEDISFNKSDFEVDYSVSNKVKILGYTGNESAVIIPEVMNGIEVTEIGDSIFANQYANEIYIHENVTKIGEKAFSGNENILIIANEESYAKSYALQYNYKYTDLETNVSFDSNGGTELDTITQEYNTIITSPANPTRSGYDFIRWEPSLPERMPAEDMVVKAIWKKISNSPSPSPSPSPAPQLPVIPEEDEDDGIVLENDENFSKEEKEESGVRVVEIKSEKDTNDIKATIKGKYQKELESDSAVISLKSNQVSYNISSKDIKIEEIAKRLSIEDDDIDSLEIDIEIKGLDEERATEIRKKANDSNYEVIFEPISFNITSRKISEDGEVTEEVIDKFDDYIERVFRIPEGIDPEKVTTGVVYRADGSFTHAPTTVYEEDGVYYAKVKSLTNSIYTLISNEIEVESVKNHWAKTPVNSLAKRLVIKEPGQFNPKGLISRGAFAEYITKAIGVYSTDVEVTQEFLDISSHNEYVKAITIANDYGIISGYPDGDFKPYQTISRQEAMAMFANAMEVIKFAGEEVDRIEKYQDKTRVSDWAYESVKNVLAARVFNGKSANTIAPKDTITYAEAATAIWNLLVKSELINK